MENSTKKRRISKRLSIVLSKELREDIDETIVLGESENAAEFTRYALHAELARRKIVRENKTSL